MSRRRVFVVSFEQPRAIRAKRSFTTRRVPLGAMRTVIGGSVRPRSGDLVLATVSRLGHHSHLEQPDGRRSSMHVGDEIVVVYADRYAPDQFESEVPADLGKTNLVASGGVASTMLSRSRDVRNASDITPIGLIGDERGRPLNLADFALRRDERAVPRPKPLTIAVLGTSMNSGKTTTVRYLVHSLSRGGHRPGATKVTGTGSGNDYWVMLDAGAHRMLDFTDVGLASTYRQSMMVVEQKFVDLVDHLTESGSGVNLVEVADGVLQRETSQLIESEVFASTVDAVIFAASDSMGAAMGVEHLRSRGFDVLAVSGRITRSPLATREAQEHIGLPVLGIEALSDLATARSLLGLGEPGPDHGTHADHRSPDELAPVLIGSSPVGPVEMGSGELAGAPTPLAGAALPEQR